MPTIRQPQPMDDETIREMLQAHWRARYPGMPSDLAALTYAYIPWGAQPLAYALLASLLAPPPTWLRATLSARS